MTIGGEIAVYQETRYDGYTFVEAVTALEAATGEVRWSVNNAKHPVYGNKRVFANSLQGNKINAYDSITGSKQWSATVEGVKEKPVAVADDRVFAAGSKKLKSLNSLTGEVQWELEFEGEIGIPPTVLGDTIVLGTVSTGKVHAISTDGAKQWTTRIKGLPSGPVSAAGDKIFVPTEQKILALTNEPNEPPTANISYSPSSPLVNQEVTFSARKSTDDERITSYKWDLDGDGDFERTGSSISRVFDEVGEHVVSLRVVDSDGVETTTRQQVTVNRPNQVPTAKFSYAPSNPIVDESVSFDASASSDPDGSIETYEWTFGNVSKTGRTVDHTFSESGTQSVTLRVVDSDGLTATAQRTIPIRQQRVSLQLTADETTITPDQNPVITLSIINYLTSEPVRVQLLLKTPSGVSVTGVANADAGSNQYTAVATIDPASETNIRVRLSVNDPGQFKIEGTAAYYFGDNKDQSNRFQDSVTFDIRGSEGASNEATDSQVTTGDPANGSGGPQTSVDIPGFGFVSALTGAGLGTAELLRRIRSESTGESAGED